MEKSERKFFNVTQADCNSAAKGLNMISMSISNLDTTIAFHKRINTFSSEVIVIAAEQIKIVKLFNFAK
jgi:hypothetical protein